MCFNNCSYYSYWLPDCAILANGRLLKLASKFFDKILVVFDSFFALWHDKAFQAHLVQRLSQALISHFSKNLLDHLVKMVFKDQSLAPSIL